MSARRIIALLCVGVAVCVVALLAWIGGELHYQSCVQRVAASTSVVSHPVSGDDFGGDVFDKPTFARAAAVETSPELSRASKLRECSRRPF